MLSRFLEILTLPQGLASSDSPTFVAITVPTISTASGGLSIIPTNKTVTIGNGAVANTALLIIAGGTSAGKGAGLSLRKGGTQFFAIYDTAGITGAGTDNTPCPFAETGLGIKVFVNGGVTKGLTLSSAGQLALGLFTPTSMLHLPAGSAVANTAPLEFTSGVVETVKRAGLVEYNGRFIVTESDTTNRYLVQAVASTKTIAGAPYTNDGYVTMTINGTDVRVMTTA